MVERSLNMQEARGSIQRFSTVPTHLTDSIPTDRATMQLLARHVHIMAWHGMSSIAIQMQTYQATPAPSRLQPTALPFGQAGKPPSLFLLVWARSLRS